MLGQADEKEEKEKEVKSIFIHAAVSYFYGRFRDTCLYINMKMKLTRGEVNTD